MVILFSSCRIGIKIRDDHAVKHTVHRACYPVTQMQSNIVQRMTSQPCVSLAGS
jgi:hypothetical protein